MLLHFGIMSKIHKIMNKSKLDAYANVSISPKEAIDGCIHKLQINDESPINLVIPPRIKHEQIMRLAGKGNFQPQTGRRGDLYLTILIEGEARTSKINIDGYSLDIRIPKNMKGLITAGIGIVLVGSLGVIAQYAEQTKNKSIPSNTSASQESTNQSNESSIPPDAENITSHNSGVEIANQVANAGPLIDGEYIGPEESFTVRGGKLYKCIVPGITMGPCSGRQIKFSDQAFAFFATQIGENAIRINKDSDLLCKDKMLPGTNAIFARCTPQGWKRN